MSCRTWRGFPCLLLHWFLCIYDGFVEVRVVLRWRVSLFSIVRLSIWYSGPIERFHNLVSHWSWQIALDARGMWWGFRRLCKSVIRIRGWIKGSYRQLWMFPWWEISLEDDDSPILFFLFDSELIWRCAWLHDLRYDEMVVFWRIKVWESV